MGSRYQDSQLYSLLEALTINTQLLLKTHAHLKKTDDYKTIEKLNLSFVKLHRNYFPEFPSDVGPLFKKDIYDHLKVIKKGIPNTIDSNLMLQYILLIQNLLIQLPEKLPEVVPFINDSNLNTYIPTKIKIKNIEGERLAYKVDGITRDFKQEYNDELNNKKEFFQLLLINYYLKKESEKIKGQAETSIGGELSQCIESLQRLQLLEENFQDFSFLTLLEEQDEATKKQAMNLFSNMPWITQRISEQKSILAEEMTRELKTLCNNKRIELLSNMSPLVCKLFIVDANNTDVAELEHIKSEIALVEEFLKRYQCPDAKQEIEQISRTLEVIKNQTLTIKPKKPARNLVPEIDAFSEDTSAESYIVNSENEFIMAKLKGELEVYSPHNVKPILDYLKELVLEMKPLDIDFSSTSMTRESLLNITREVQNQIEKSIPEDLELFLNLLLYIRHEKIYNYDQISKKCSEIKINPHQYGLQEIPKSSAQAQRFIEKKIKEINDHQKNPLINKGRNLISLLSQLRLAAEYIDESTAYSELITANKRINNQDVSEDINLTLYLTQLKTIQSNMDKLINRHFNTTHDQKYRLYELFDFSGYHKMVDVLKQKLTSMAQPIIATETNISNMQRDLKSIQEIITILNNKNMSRFINDPSDKTSALSQLHHSVSLKITALQETLEKRAQVAREIKPLCLQLHIIDADKVIEEYKQNGELSSILNLLNAQRNTDARTYSIINKIKVKLLEYERTAPHNLREDRPIDDGQLDFRQAISKLKKATQAIKNQRWAEATELSMQLDNDLKFFEENYGEKATEAEYNHFKELFLARIHSHEVTIRNHRALWKPILANILIGLFSFGIVLGFRLAHTYQKNGTATLFFHKTQKEKDVAEIEEVFSQQAPAA